MPLYAICPYFMYDKKTVIGCEFKNISFSTSKDKRIWMRNLCCTFDYNHCANAIELNRKYDEMYRDNS